MNSSRHLLLLGMFLCLLHSHAQVLSSEIKAVTPPINVWKDGLPNNAKPNYFMTSDLAYFELRGHVKECVDPDDGIVTKFDIDGHLVSSTHISNPIHDTRGRIVREGSDDPSDMDGVIYYVTTVWLDDYTMLTQSTPNPEGDINIRFVYADNLNGTKVRNIIRREFSATGPNYSGTVTYDYVSFDDQGNWTCRWVKNNLYCRWDGGSSVKTTEIEHRKITYWEQCPLDEGRLYLYDRPGIPHDYKKALDLFNKAAQQGDPDALWELGNIYRRGWGVKRSNYQAEEYYTQAARKGNPYAKYWLAYMHENGLVVLKSDDPDISYKLYREAYLKLKEIDDKGKGDLYTWEYLGRMNLYGDGIMEKSQKEKTNSDEEKDKLVEFLTASNPLAAFEYYKKSGNEGNAYSQYAMGMMCSDPNYKSYNLYAAEKWFDLAVKQGYPEAFSSMGVIMLNKNENAKALDYFNKGDVLGDSSATYNLGLCYKNGWGVTQSFGTATSYFVKAAQMGNEKAIEMLKLLGVSTKE